jgi:hypothetical protein
MDGPFERTSGYQRVWMWQQRGQVSAGEEAVRLLIVRRGLVVADIIQTDGEF